MTAIIYFSRPPIKLVFPQGANEQHALILDQQLDNWVTSAVWAAACHLRLAGFKVRDPENAALIDFQNWEYVDKIEVECSFAQAVAVLREAGFNIEGNEVQL